MLSLRNRIRLAIVEWLGPGFVGADESHFVPGASKGNPEYFHDAEVDALTNSIMTIIRPIERAASPVSEEPNDREPLPSFNRK